MIAKALVDLGWSLRKSSLSGVCWNLRFVSSAKMPTLVSIRSNRFSEGA